jgi:glyoxylase-like metal-dependent hydrolase (beta-lactamase superfamily II)
MSIPFVKDFDFKYGECSVMSPLVKRVIANNPGPFTYTGTGVYIIGNKEVAIIDPGPNTPEHKNAIKKVLRGKKVTHIFLTHHHLDHSPLAKPLALEYGCNIYGLSIDIKKRNSFPSLEAGEDNTFKPDIDVKCGDLFKGGEWTIEAIHTPGHTSNHVCYALKEENLLFSGDHIMGWSTSVVSPYEGHMGDYINSLKKIKERDFSIIFPTHGTYIDKVDSFIDAYINHRYYREKQIIEALKTGSGLILDIVKKLYLDLDKRLYPAAAHSVLSHLIYLREKGVVMATADNGLDCHYKIIES